MTAAPATHPWPLLVDNPRRYCTACGVHVACETGVRPQLCCVCKDKRKARR